MTKWILLFCVSCGSTPLPVVCWSVVPYNIYPHDKNTQKQLIGLDRYHNRVYYGPTFDPSLYEGEWVSMNEISAPFCKE